MKRKPTYTQTQRPPKSVGASFGFIQFAPLYTPGCGGCESWGLSSFRVYGQFLVLS